LFVPPDPRIAEFIEKALGAGIPHESLVGVLTSQGWSERDVYDALADHYRRLTGIDIPRRAGAGASAKEAFFYLLIFSTLATWTIGFACLAFAVIDRWLADPLFSQGAFDNYIITSSLAALIVAFPLYLLISRIVAGEVAAQPERLDSPIRKWLTYMALVIAAAVFMGDLITALAYLLRGEVTSRFLCKSFVVLALSGGVFSYYFGGLRKTDAVFAGLSRERLMAGVCTAIVVLMVVLGFWQLGSPHLQREYRADNQRVRDLYQLATRVNLYWTMHHASHLPQALISFQEMSPWIPSPTHLMSTTPKREAGTSSARSLPGAATRARMHRIHGPTPPDTTVFRWMPPTSCNSLRGTPRTKAG
jgi:hypothetical protein